MEPQPLADLIQEILQKHIDGIHFREWNAGTMLDEHMKDNGFNIDIHVDREVCVRVCLSWNICWECIVAEYLFGL